MSKADIGLVGLAVMGENLVLNMERNGFTVAVYNRTTSKVDDFVNGRGGAGHFVKMVHNGIEYGDMQMICETYQVMKDGLGMSNDEMHEAFTRWNEGVLDSYLIEITRDILGYRDEHGEATLDYILDTAGQKGSGKWTGVSALNAGQPLTAIGEAVFARFLSALKDERLAAAAVLPGPDTTFDGDREAMIDDLEQALARHRFGAGMAELMVDQEGIEGRSARVPSSVRITSAVSAAGGSADAVSAPGPQRPGRPARPISSNAPWFATRWPRRSGRCPNICWHATGCRHGSPIWRSRCATICTSMHAAPCDVRRRS